MARQWGASFQWFNGRFWVPTRPAHKAVTASTWTAASGAAARYFKKNVLPPRAQAERVRLEVWPIASAREVEE